MAYNEKIGTMDERYRKPMSSLFLSMIGIFIIMAIYDDSTWIRIMMVLMLGNAFLALIRVGMIVLNLKR